MLKKNIEKNERKRRSTWNGYYSRATATKAEKSSKENRRNKSKKYSDFY